MTSVMVNGWAWWDPALDAGGSIPWTWVLDWREGDHELNTNINLPFSHHGLNAPSNSGSNEPFPPSVAFVGYSATVTRKETNPPLSSCQIQCLHHCSSVKWRLEDGYVDFSSKAMAGTWGGIAKYTWPCCSVCQEVIPMSQFVRSKSHRIGTASDDA